MTIDYSKIEAKEKKAEELPTKEDKPKADVVVSKRPKKQKKGLMERLVVGLIGPDGVQGVGSYLGREIVVPAVKNIIVDSITSGINMVMFGNEQARPTNRTNYGGPSAHHWQRPKTNYASNYKPTSNYSSSATKSAPRRAKGNYVDDYVIQDRHEALGVLDALTEQIVAYGSVSVADYYDMIGVEPSYTDNTYGWTEDDLSRATVVPTRGGYVLKLPPVSVI